MPKYTQERADAVMDQLDIMAAEIKEMFPAKKQEKLLKLLAKLEERLQLEFEELANSGNPWANVN
jgi:hypothetical protein